MSTGPRPLFGPDPDQLDEPLDQVAAELSPASDRPDGERGALPLPEIPPDEPFAARVRAVRTAPMTIPESRIVEELLGWLNVQHRVHARKVHQTAVTGSGEPDLDICWNGRTVKIEVKRPGEVPRRVQLRRMLVWQEAGALVGWVTSLDDLRRIIAHVGDPGWRSDLTTPGA